MTEVTPATEVTMDGPVDATRLAQALDDVALVAELALMGARRDARLLDRLYGDLVTVFERLLDRDPREDPAVSELRRRAASVLGTLAQAGAQRRVDVRGARSASAAPRSAWLHFS